MAVLNNQRVRDKHTQSGFGVERVERDIQWHEQKQHTIWLYMIRFVSGTHKSFVTLIFYHSLPSYVLIYLTYIVYGINMIADFDNVNKHRQSYPTAMILGQMHMNELLTYQLVHSHLFRQTNTCKYCNSVEPTSIVAWQANLLASDWAKTQLLFEVCSGWMRLVVFFFTPAHLYLVNVWYPIPRCNPWCWNIYCTYTFTPNNGPVM